MFTEKMKESLLTEQNKYVRIFMDIHYGSFEQIMNINITGGRHETLYWCTAGACVHISK